MNPAGVYYYTHMTISYRQVLVTIQGVPARMFTTTLTSHHRSSPERRLSGLVSAIVNPAGLPMRTQTMCAGPQAGPGWAVHSLRRPCHRPTRTRNYCDSWTSIRDELIGREGSVSPMCGCTLCLGLPHKNSDLRQCSTRQPTVYSYTASHRHLFSQVRHTLLHHK